jgi:hypothetical protein
MILFQDQYEAVIENAPVGRVERLRPLSRAQLPQHVVEAGKRQMRALGENAALIASAVGLSDRALIGFEEAWRRR